MRAHHNRAPEWLRRSFNWLALVSFIAAAACVPAHLNTTASTTFDVDARQAADNTNTHAANQSFSVVASCQPNETLVGGGYLLVPNDASNFNGVVVEANYPSSKSTWTVQARNPDIAPYNGDGNTMVMALAYCVTTPNFALQTEIQEVDHVMAPTLIVGATDPIDIRCSKTSAVALSAGFSSGSLPVVSSSTVHYQASWGGLDGSGIVSSIPMAPDASHSAMGWRVEREYTPARDPTQAQPPVTTKVFLLCALTGLNDQAYQIIKTTKVLAPADPSSDAMCPPNQFTVGGGYQITRPKTGAAGQQIASNLSPGANSLKFAQWSVSGDSNAQSVDTYALCYVIP
jgi:hypothetical protein